MVPRSLRSVLVASNMVPRFLRSILVASDLGEGSDAVVRGAAALAAATGAELHVLHALNLDAPPYGVQKGGSIGGLAERIDDATRTLEAQLGRAVPGDVSAQPHVLDYAAHRAIAEHARRVAADLIVLGPHAHAGVQSALLGSTADRVLRTVEVPCLVLRAPLTLPLRRVGVAMDFSEPARGALDVALQWAARLGTAREGEGPARAQLQAIHVAAPLSGDAGPPPSDGELLARLEEQLEEVGRRHPGSEVEVRPAVLRESRVPDAVVDHARRTGLELLVIGTHGYGGVARMLIGSVATGVARAAPCPVLLVPPRLAHRVVTGAEAWRAHARVERTLVAVDFTAPSLAAAEWTVRQFAPEAEPHFVHVLDLHEPPVYLGGPTAGARREMHETWDRADIGLRQLARSLTGREPVLLREGRAEVEILRAAEEHRVDLIAVGEHGRRGVGGWLGSTAERILTASPAPVLLVRQPPAAGPRRILAAVDESEISTGVLAWASYLAERFAARVVALYALDVLRFLAPYPLDAAPAELPLAQGMESERKAASVWLEGRVRAAAFPPGAAQVRVEDGEPAAVVLDAAAREQAELIVMGSRGAGTVGRLLLGSVSRAVLRGAGCSVLIVGEPKWARSAEAAPETGLWPS